jgi:two-component system nitrogen regulation sensor histidine kinase GlnL
MSQLAGQILDNLSTAVLCLDHTLKIKMLNLSAQNLLAISDNKGLDSRLSDYLRNFREIESVLFDALQTGQPYTQRKALLTLSNSQTITVDYTVSPMSEGDWPMLVLELQPLDRLLRIDRDEIVRIHQETSHQMIRGLAHEIKNPLGGIRGAAQLLAQELEDKDLDDYTAIIIEETDRLRNLVDRLLGPNRLPTLIETNIHEVLEKVCALIEAETLGLKIKRDYDPSIPALKADKEQLHQCILNIVRNAMQAVIGHVESPEIILVTRTERQFTIGTIRHRLVARIDIIDNGPGIAEGLKDQLFFPMISGRPEGTGLGLSVAHSIIARHHGIIEFHSQPGKTIFSLLIPLEQTDA